MMSLRVIDRTALGTGLERTSEVTNSRVIISGARLVELSDGTPHLRIEPRVSRGLTLTEGQDFLNMVSGTQEAYATSKIGLKLKPVPSTAFFYGFEYEQDVSPRENEYFLKLKLGTGLQFNATTGALEATAGGGSTTPATTTALGTVIVGSGLSVVTTAGPTQGTISVNTGTGLSLSGGAVTLGIASAGTLGGIRVGTGLSINGSGVLSADAQLSNGVANTIPKWTSSTVLGNSNITDNGTTVAITGAVTVSSTLGVTGLTTLTRATVNAAVSAAQTLLVNAATNASGDGLVITGNTRQVADAASNLLLVTSRTNQTALAVAVSGQITLGSGLLWNQDATFDIGASGVNRPKDLYLSGAARLGGPVVIGTDPNPATGGGLNAPLRVAGLVNPSTGYYEAAYFTGAVFASDFVLIDGTGAVASAGPPIVVLGNAVANGTPAALNTTLTPLSQITFQGTGVTTTMTNGQAVVTITAGTGGGGLATSGTVTANAIPRFAGGPTTFTITDSGITDNGTTISLARNTSVTGTMTATTFSGSGASLTSIPQSAVTNLTTDLSAKAPLASPTFTGTPAAPTAVAGTNTTQLATTAFVTTAVNATVPVSRGGTGLTATPTNGQLLIGNGTGFTLASLTAGTNITITPGAGTITISASGGGGGTTTNALTFNNGGSGAASGTTFNGASAVTVSYNTVGAPSTTGTNASGTWNISISGSANSASSATTATTATNLSGGSVSATTGTFSSTLSVTGASTFNGTVGVTNTGTNSATWKVGGVQYATVATYPSAPTGLPATAPDGALMVLY